MAVLGTALFAGGTALQVSETRAQGKEAVRIAKRNRQILEKEAAVTEDVGLFESGEKRLEGKRLMAAQIAQIGAKGGGLSGTNLMVLLDSAMQVEQDARIISRNTRLRARGLREQGAMGVYQARMARRGLRIRAMGTGIKAGATLLRFQGLGKKTSKSVQAYNRKHSPGVYEGKYK